MAKLETAEAKGAFKSGYYRVAAEESLFLDSESFAIEPGQVYEAQAWVVGYEGNPGCALVAVIFLGRDGKEVYREATTIDDFSGRAKAYKVEALAPPGAARALVVYRANTELPGGCAPASCKLWVGPPSLTGSGLKTDQPALEIMGLTQQDVSIGIASAQVAAASESVNTELPGGCAPASCKLWAGPPRLTSSGFETEIQGDSGMKDELPIPPLEMRKLVGPTDPETFSNPTGEPLFSFLPAADYDSVLDFGCGCGRVARMLIQQRPRPKRYLGIDLHHGMIEWCTANLAPHAPGFEFRHHDVDYALFNPGKGKPRVLPFPADDASFTLVIAISVFTHLLQDQTVHYLSECARVLSPRGVLVSTWFLFDKRYFPMMQEGQNTLFISEVDPRNAVIYDREWLLGAAANAGLVVTLIGPPEVRGFQWTVAMARSDSGLPRAPFPETEFAPFGIRRAPADVKDPHLVGRTR